MVGNIGVRNTRALVSHLSRAQGGCLANIVRPVLAGAEMRGVPEQLTCFWVLYSRDANSRAESSSLATDSLEHDSA